MVDLSTRLTAEEEQALTHLGVSIKEGDELIVPDKLAKELFNIDKDRVLKALNTGLTGVHDIRIMDRDLFSESVEGKAYYLGFFHKDRCLHLFTIGGVGNDIKAKLAKRKGGEPLSDEATMNEDLRRRKVYPEFLKRGKEKIRSGLASKNLTAMLARDIGEETRRDVIFILGCSDNTIGIPEALKKASLDKQIMIAEILLTLTSI